MGSVLVGIESNRGHPRIDDLRVLSRGQMRRAARPTRKQKLIASELRVCDSGLDGFTRLFRQLNTGGRRSHQGEGYGAARSVMT
jgi:hypothetical protein